MADEIVKPTPPEPINNLGGEDIRRKFDGLAEQVQVEYDLAWEHQKPKKDVAEVRLKLYNNQKRDPDAAGDTTMFSIFQTVLASLYVDRLSSEWSGREDGDEEVADNLTAMAQYDYEEMGKDETDFEWIWDTLFFGRGLCNLSEWIRDTKNKIFVPAPEIWDPITFLRDPRAHSVNGNRLLHRNAARFFGREIKLNKDEIRDGENSNPNFFGDVDFRTLKFGAGTKSLINDAVQARIQAQGLQQPKSWNESKLGANSEYDVTHWFTHFKIGSKTKKVEVWLGNDRKYLLGVRELEDGPWGLIDRPLYPTAHDWDGTSIPDLTEDKQRLRAVAQNLGIKAMMADLYPMYVYDINKITNPNDLNFAFNKWIKSNGPASGAAEPLRKSMENINLLNFIYTTLDVSAQKATATPDIQQGIQSQKDRPLGETNLLAANTGTRYSLSARIFGWSEKRFWQQWYRMYKMYFADTIDEKIVRIEGAFGTAWRPLTKDQLIAKNIDPDVKIDSQVLSRAKMLEDRQSYTAFFALAFQDPKTNRRYGQRKLGKLYGMRKDELDRLFPPTIEELNAEDENDFLNENKLHLVSPNDDHITHMDIHSKATETPAKMAHLKAHKLAMRIQRDQPELFPNLQPAATPGAPGAALPGGLPSGNQPVAPSETSNQPTVTPTS